MNQEEIKDAVLGIISDIAPDEDLQSLAYEKSLRDQLDLDSMDFLDIVMELRKRYKVEVPSDDYKHLDSLKSTVDYLKPKMQ